MAPWCRIQVSQTLVCPYTKGKPRLSSKRREDRKQGEAVGSRGGNEDINNSILDIIRF